MQKYFILPILLTAFIFLSCNNHQQFDSDGVYSKFNRLADDIDFSEQEAEILKLVGNDPFGNQYTLLKLNNTGNDFLNSPSHFLVFISSGRNGILETKKDFLSVMSTEVTTDDIIITIPYMYDKPYAITVHYNMKIYPHS